jgi:hypothetical protein
LSETNVFRQPRDDEKKIAGVELFRAFIKRSKNLNLKKPEGLSVTRVEGLNTGQVSAYFSKVATILEEP